MNAQEKSSLFRIYNKARMPLKKWMGEKGFSDKQKKSQMSRLNRAFGIIQANDFSHRDEYRTTTKACNCPDAQFDNGYICKHRLAERMYQLIGEAEAQVPQVKVTKRTYGSNLVREAVVDYMHKTFRVFVKYAISDSYNFFVSELTPVGEKLIDDRNLRSVLEQAVLSLNGVR